MKEQETSDLIGQRKIRLDKLNSLRSIGINPYPAKSDRNTQLTTIKEKFNELENSKVIVAGRILTMRGHGHLLFFDLRDQSGEVQIYIKDDELEQTSIEKQILGFDNLKLLDTGDFIEVLGSVTKTKSGEISVKADQIKILSKTIRPLPDLRTGIIDKEERFRRRYVDMTVNPDVRKMFERRAEFWQAHRDFLNSKGFFEVNIPILEHIPGGGDAVPFTTHMNAIDEDFFLRISHELPLKRLVGAGFEKVYDIGARFRNEGLSDEHLPEHIAMEFYWAYADWKDGMQLVKEMFNYIIDRIYGGKKVFQIREFEVDFSKDWEIIDFKNIMSERYGIKDIYSVDLETVKEKLKENNIEFDDKTVNIPRGVDSLWKKVRKTIAGPAFLVNHPKFLSPLQKPSLEDKRIVERMQPIIAGSELGNGWSEVNDAVDQYERFLEQQELRDSGDDEAQWLDIDYVEMLEYGMPPTFGWGHSERLFWFLENVTAREGVPFPQLKYHVSELTKKIYPEVNFDEIRNTDEHKEIEQKKTNSDSTKSDLSYDKDKLPSIEAIREFVHNYVSDEYQRHHAEMVSEAMGAVAKELNEDENLFRIVGLVHDWDFDKWPNEHPGRYDQLKDETGLPEIVVDAIKGHADLSYPRTTKVAQALLACDEFSGLLYAYMKMVGNYKDMKTKSIRKKVHKEVNFAAKINREDVKTGIDELGIPEDRFFELIRNTFSEKYD